MLTNAVAIYLLHDVGADRIGKWNLAYSELTQEFVLFAIIGQACSFFGLGLEIRCSIWKVCTKR